MRKTILAFIAVIILLLFSLTACKEQATDVVSVSAPLESGSVIVSPSGEPEGSPPAVSVSPLSSVSDEQAVAIYSTFLTENYDMLNEALFGSIAGIGFIDLDCDGCRELILFDSGASAAMGVQFFDIVNGKVECVSANMPSIMKLYGGEHVTDNYVNANLMEDFRLMENKTTGERFFLIESGNGNIEFYYRELIRFGSADGVLSLSSLAYKHDTLDIDTGESVSQQFRVDDKQVSLGEYNSAVAKIFGDAKDLGLECRGVFMWEQTSYQNGFDGYMEMVTKAMELGDGNMAP